MARKAANMLDADRDRSIALSRAISETVLDILKHRGMTQSALAEGIGMSRAGLCQAMNARSASRVWRLPALCGMCRVLGVKEEELFALAAKRCGQKKDADKVRMTLWLYTLNNEPATLDRLQSIVCAATDHGPEQNEIRLFEIGCRSFVGDYLSGGLSDESAYHWLKQAEDERNAEPDVKKRLPLWAMLAEMYGSKE